MGGSDDSDHWRTLRDVWMSALCQTSRLERDPLHEAGARHCGQASDDRLARSAERSKRLAEPNSSTGKLLTCVERADGNRCSEQLLRLQKVRGRCRGRSGVWSGKRMDRLACPTAGTEAISYGQRFTAAELAAL